MNHRPVMRVRRESWGIAAFFIIAFCWLGFLTFKWAPIFEGLWRVPTSTRLVVAYGAVAFPLLGIVAAATLILSSMFLAHRMQWVWILLFTLILIWGFRALFFSGGGGLGPAIKANNPNAPNAAVALQIQSERTGRGVGDLER